MLKVYIHIYTVYFCGPLYNTNQYWVDTCTMPVEVPRGKKKNYSLWVFTFSTHKNEVRINVNYNNKNEC